MKCLKMLLLYILKSLSVTFCDILKEICPIAESSETGKLLFLIGHMFWCEYSVPIGVCLSQAYLVILIFFMLSKMV